MLLWIAAAAFGLYAAGFLAFTLMYLSWFGWTLDGILPSMYAARYWPFDLVDRWVGD